MDYQKARKSQDAEGKAEKELTLHPDRQGLRMVLGDLEAEVMEVVWRHSMRAEAKADAGSQVEPSAEAKAEAEARWCTVRDVYETLRDERQRRIAYTTVMNTMTRLAKKGVLESRRQDMAYLYRPRQSQEDFIHGVVGHVLERLLVQFTGPTQRGLQDYSARHPEEARKVEGLLSDIERRRAGQTGRAAQTGQASLQAPAEAPSNSAAQEEH
ncbi:MAG TPA: BlaI/MecI/CopY family transcriptional regulator [Chloroflexia bacterium]|jgi:predicted transcriptional regulator